MASKTKVTIKRLKGKKKYFVRARLYRKVKINGKTKKIYSAWSKTKNIRIKQQSIENNSEYKY